MRFGVLGTGGALQLVLLGVEKARRWISSWDLVRGIGDGGNTHGRAAGQATCLQGTGGLVVLGCSKSHLVLWLLEEGLGGGLNLRACSTGTGMACRWAERVHE
jgi:hypothetical protein